MMQGTVKWFDDQKGYGFIRTEGITEDIFVHQKAIKMEGFRSLAPGDTVEFRLSRSEKGFKAEEVVRIGAAEAQSA